MRKFRNPFLFLLVLMVCTLTPLRASAANSLELQLYQLLSEDRAANGRHTLVLDEELCRIARLKSQDMLENNYCGHLSPTYGRVRDMLDSFGVSYLSAGENVARSRSVAHSNAAFLSSTGHRINMLSRSYTHIGIGVATNQYGHVYVTEIFVRR